MVDLKWNRRGVQLNETVVRRDPGAGMSLDLLLFCESCNVEWRQLLFSRADLAKARCKHCRTAFDASLLHAGLRAELPEVG